MKKLFLNIIFFVFFLNFSYSQDKYLATNGYVGFFSEAKIENIKADNNQVLSIIDVSSKEIVIHLLMKSFIFEKSLMQEHFNENYIESDKYPKAKFKGKFEDFDIEEGIEKEILLQGNLSLHGKTKEIELPVNVKKENDMLVIKGNFNILLRSYNIKVPRVTKHNIAKSIKISFDIKHNKYEK